MVPRICERSLQCRFDGKCSFSYDTFDCVAASDSDCRYAPLCQNSGLGCAFSATEHACVVTAAECEKGDACTTFGRCAPTTRACTFSQEGCRKSEQCVNAGQCALAPLGCEMGSDEDCRAAPGCKEHGQCKAGVHWCEVGSNADCAAANTCTRGGACTAAWPAHGCVRSADKECALQPSPPRGADSSTGQCIHTSDGDCEKSTDCARYGRCKLGHSICEANNDADCAKSAECKERHRCRSDGLSCVE